MKNTKRDASSRKAFSARLQQRMRIQDEPRFYFVLQLVFAAAQILLAYVAFGEQNIANTGIWLFAVFGVLVMMMAGKGWQSRGIRVCGRILSAVVLLFFLVILLLDVFTTQIYEATGTRFITREPADYLWQFLCYLCQFVQPLLLMLFPTFAIASRRMQKRIDIRALQIGSWVLVLMAVGTLVLSYESGMTRMAFTSDMLGIPNQVLLIAYLICTLAAAFSVIMLYPYGIQWLKRRIDTARTRSAAQTDADAVESVSSATEE